MFYKGNEDREKRLRFSIRKVSFGAASVAVAALFMFPGNGTVSATEQGVTPTNEGRQGSPLKDPDVQNGTYGATPVVNQLDGNSGSSETTAPKGQEETSTTATPAPVVSSPASVTEEAEEKATPDLDKKQLEDYVAEIDAKLASGSYATKTDESVATLKEHLELAKLALTTAKSQDELTKAYRKLLMTASSGLRNKPKAQVESPKLDTTEGKATVGKKASTTDKATGTNSIANSGQHDPRNGQALDRNNPFRTDGTTTDTDPDANQTYTLPGDSANLKEVANSLINLPTKITNETKITSINEVGALQKIAPGEVKDINEFGGWKATSGGVFAIARRTDKGVFPIETVNTVLVQNGPYRTWLNESTFDRSKDYALFLAEVRTKATEEEAVDDGSVYVAERHYANKGIGLAKFKGIEKTFKAYSKSTGSDVIVSFKTGFTGDIDGKKAKYRVEVFAKDESGTTRTIYDQIFSPNENREDETKKVVAPIIGRDQYFDTNRASLPTRETLNEKLEQDPNKRRLGTSTGTFTSKGIVLEPNVTEYTVRISPGDNANLGMGYQVPWKQYALPISGLGFTLEQDTSRVAKALLQRVYNKLKETEEKDTKGKTEATINDYRTQLENVNKLLTGDLKKTQDYKDIVTTVLAAQQALRTDKSKLDTANTKLLNLINENPDPRIGKTLTSITSYDFAKTEAINAQTEAQKILNQDNPDPDVVATIASELNEKLAELKIARAELVDKATEEQKTKLEADAGKLTKASTEGKTQDSITAYNEKYAQLATELEAAKNKATAIKEAGDNASEHEALKAQAAVDGVLAKLEAAKAVLVDKATDDQVSELRKADVSLTPASASTFETAKTPASIAAYKKAVEAIQTDLTEAKATAADLVRKAEQNNATQADATSAIAKVDKLKVELAKANALLKDKANTSDLATAKDALKELAKVENATDGKTTSTAAAYTAAKQAADAAVAKAEGLMANPNVTPEEVAEALTEVKARKDELEKAKVALVDKATEEQKTKLEADAGKLTKASTEGKTQDSITAYNEKYAQLATELEAAKNKATAIKEAGDNASEHEALKAQAAVDGVLAKLEAAKAVLVDKATDDQVSELRKADVSLTPASASTFETAKTPASIAAYKKAVEAIQTDLTEAKATAADLVRKAEQNNATQADATSAIAKVDKLKVELAKANALLKDKANTSDLATAKDALKELAKVENATDGKTTSTAAAYTAAKQAADAAVAKAEGLMANPNVTPEEVAEALTEVKARKDELEKAKVALVDKATEEQKTKLEADAGKLTKASTEGKTQDSITAYNEKYAQLATELEAAKNKATAIKEAGDNASEHEALKAQAAVDGVLAKLEAAKAVLVDKATDDQVSELRKADVSLTPASASTFETAKTPASIAAYKKAVEAIQTDLTEAKATAADLVRKAEQNNATQADATSAIAKVDKLKVELAKANALLKDKANTSDLATAKDALKELAKVENATDGKTTSTAAAYTAAKQAADAAVAKAEGLMANPNVTPEEVAEALTEVKARKDELEKAKVALVDKATEEQKTKLEADAGKLTKASTEGKTQDSITAYNEKYAQLATELEAAKNKATAIKEAGDNASEHEALKAQAAVDGVLAKLEAAKAVLVDKATDDQVSELRKADVSLTPASASTFETAKTPASIAAYKKAVEAIQTDLTEAKATAADLVRKAEQNNATQADATSAIAKVDKLKVELAKANALLKDKANTSDLATAKDALKELAKVENATDGKTTSTAAAYTAAKQAADAAVAKAEGLMANPNVTPEEVAEALTEVKARKDELEKAKVALVDKATEEQKTKLEADAGKLTKASTEGKTQDSITAYNEKYAQLATELEAAKNKATAIKEAGDNASEHEALKAQAAVDGVLAKLEAAKAVLVDKATDDQVSELRKADVSLTPASASTFETAKTPASIAAYKKAVEAIQTDLTEAKATAADLVRKAEQNNATQADATSAIAKVDKLKVELAKANALLKDKANTSDLATAKDALKELAKVENATDGKTTSTAAAYTAAKQAADAAVAKAEGLMANPNVTPEEVAEALTEVKARKDELEKAKVALVDKATEEQKTKLEADAGKLTKASTEGKTQDSITAYNEKYAQLATELEAAKNKATAIKEAGDNASEHEALKAQAAVDGVLAKLEAAKAVLVDKATDDQVSELRKADVSLTPASASTFETAKTPASIAAYKKAVEAIQTDLTEAKATAADLVRKAEQNNATQADATSAIAKVDKLKVELAKANALLKDKANTSDLATAKDALKELAKVENATDGKTTSTAAAYTAAKQAADAAVAKAEGLMANPNVTPEEVAEALTEVKARKDELEKAKVALVDKATEEQKTKLEADAGKLTKASTEGKTQDSITAYNEKYAQLATELEAAKNKATAIKEAGDNASEHEALKAQAAVDGVLAKLEAAKAVLVDKATDDQVSELRKADVSLTPASASTFETAKTPASIAAYKKAVEAIQTDLTEAKATAADLVRKAEQNNATQADATSAIAKVDKLKVELAKANALLKDKANTSDLATAKDALKELAKVENATDGKTTSTAAAYTAAKQAADAAVAKAEGLMANPNVTPEEVAEALTEVKARKDELEKAKVALVDKATEEQKTKLEADAGKLTKASTEGKTQDSITAYNEKYAQLATELEAAKNKATAIKEAGDNASEHEALKAQAAVDGVLAKLEAAKAVLVDKATDDQVSELRKADVSLTPASASTFETAKTPASIAAYKKAVEAIQTDLTEAKATAADLVRKAEQNNATQADATSAIAKVDKLKVELAKANALLKDKANTSDLATAKDALKELAKVENATDGKTTSTAAAYTAAKQAADAAVAKAEGLMANPNVTPEEVAEALTEVKARKDELEKAKVALVDKATEEQKTKLEADAGKLTKASTEGKTQDSITAYNEKYAQLATELEAAKNKATAIKEAGDNASEHEALKAQAAVDGVLAKLEAAKAVLVDKATDDQVSELRKADVSLTPASASTFETAKTPASIAAYKKAVEAIQTDLTEAKATAADLVRKAEQNNATQADATSAIAKVDKLKVELAKANALLKDKANTSDLATAKDALKELAKVENATDGKTTSTAAAYTAAKQAADAAVAKAEGLMANPNVTPEEVAEALTEVKARKDELEKAKVALVDKATEEQKTKLEADAGKLTKASTEGKTQDSITAYNEKYAQLATELEAAKTEAEKVLAKENNATKEEVTAAQAKVDAVKAELDKAVELLKDLDREAAKKEIADAAKTATDAIEASTSFTPEQKAEEKVKVAKEATDATDAIDKATTEAELDKALRTFLYQMDQDSLVYERPSFDLEAFIQSSITGVVTVERGKAIHQADIIAKLNLPESITVISIDLPDTNTLGDKFAKVMLRLADGKEITVKVPVRVVASQSGESKPETSLPDYGRNNGSTNTDAKVDKAKLEGAIRQLDELIIKESAKLDAETAKEANDLLADAKKVFANADASQAEVDAMVKRIEDFMAKVSPSTDHATPANDQAAQTPAVAPANASQTASAQANARKAAKELPNTGTADSTVAMVAAAASALLGLGLAGRRRKEDEEA